MKKFVIFSIILGNYICCSSAKALSKKDELVSVIVVFRHGDRSPIKSFPNDEYYNLTYFPMGWSQLTKNGIDREYKLGQWLRTRYDGFLPKTYSKNDIYVYSTDTDRTLMSAAANVAGLYPPEASQAWNPGLMWQPIPIHTIPRNLDQIVTEHRYCAKYGKLLDEVKQDDHFRDINKQYSDLYDTVSNHTGWIVNDMSFVKDLRSVLYSYKNYNTSFIPAWAKDLDQRALDYLSAVTYQRKSFTKNMKRLSCGPFFYHIISHFEKIINQTTDIAKFLMISAHDITLVPILDSMGAYDYWPPDYAATVIWELRKKPDDNFYVNVLYKQISGLDSLTVQDCEGDCDFKKFKMIMQPITLDIKTWEKECEET